MKAKEDRIVKEVMACAVSPVAMFLKFGDPRNLKIPIVGSKIKVAESGR